MDEIWERLATEQQNRLTENLDTMTTLAVIEMMNEADRTVANAVQAVSAHIAKAVDIIVERLSAGGRLFYIGAGTSGRLGILDAAECPPTFNTPPNLVKAIIAGGEKAVFESVEEAEDSPEHGANDLKVAGFSAGDVVVAITASGRTPYVLGALHYARECEGATIALSCNKGALVSQAADVAIEVETGPEVLMGSTRLKAGTAQKLVLNMLSTATMVRLGKVYQNLMVDLRATNHKLVERSKRIVMLATGAGYDEAADVLLRAEGHVKTAILMQLKNMSKSEADARLIECGGHLHRALVQ